MARLGLPNWALGWWLVTLLALVLCPAGVCFAASAPVELSRAADRGDVEAVRRALTDGASAQGLTVHDKNSALSDAIRSFPEHVTESKQNIKLLLEHGASVTAKLNEAGYRPINAARTPEALEFVLDNAIDIAAESDDALATRIACNLSVTDPVGMFTVLLAHGVRITSSPEGELTALHCAVFWHRLDLEDFLLNHGVSPEIRDARGRTALFDATDLATTEPLLRHGADIEAVDSHNVTPLFNAVEDGRQSMALLLLARGANPHAVTTRSRPVTIVQVAAATGQLEVLSALLAEGMEVNATDRTVALHAAIASNQVAAASALLDSGADVNAKAEQGRSPLHSAASLNSVAMVSLLLSHHADVTARDDYDLPPQRLTTSEDVLALLASAGAPVEPQSPTALDALACKEVLQSRLWKGFSGDDREPERLTEPADPRDSWNFQGPSFLVQNIRQEVIHIQKQDYVLGVWSGKPQPMIIPDFQPSPEAEAEMQRELSHPRVRKGPVYLARRGRDGVVSVECEFKSSTRLGFTEYHVMTPLDRLQARAQIESLTTSQVAMKEPGLWGAQALLEAADKSLPGLSSLCSDSRECVLDDAIEAHRDDVLRFFLERGVSSVVMRVKNPLRPPHVGELWEVGRRDWRDDPLFVAIARGTPDSVHVLLEHGANPDAVGDPNPFSGADTFFPARALAWAVEHGRLTLVQTLLEHGADPNLAVSSLAPLSTTLSDIVNEKPLAEVQAAGVHQLFLHGADPNPPLSAAFQTYARIKAREDLAAKARNSPDQTVQTQWVKEAIITPGPSEALAEAMLNDTLAFRDASDCEPSASLAELAICLPNTLKRANAALDRSRQNRSLAAVDRKCDTHLAGLHTRAGWLSYVLSDQSRALCVLAELRVQKRT